jgi:hypothetical protein
MSKAEKILKKSESHPNVLQLIESEGGKPIDLPNYYMFPDYSVILLEDNKVTIKTLLED